MKLFEKNTIQANSQISDKAAGRIANGILKTQKIFANALGKMANSWHTKHQWIFLCLVCLVFGGLSFVAVITPFNKKARSFLTKPSSIKIPRTIYSNQDLHSIIITKNEIRKVYAFRHVLDSLSASIEGKKKVNIFLNKRPGLLDSLDMVERLYYLQKK